VLLQQLHESYAARGFAVLGFPSNDFANEEPGTNAEVKRFATSRFGVTFPMFAKIPVTGPNAHPLYKHIATESVLPRWNFHKYLVDTAGRVVANFDPKIEPDAAELVSALESLLGDVELTES
jgi:glutathione peroxidase